MPSSITSGNNIGDQGCLAFARAVAVHHSLQHVDIGGLYQIWI